MSRAFGFAIALIVTTYVSAQAPTCRPGYAWTFNSLNQSPCTMTIALGGVCAVGAFTLDPLPSGFVYLGPTQLGATPCRCSTVYYSLLSACALCQNATWLDWSIYDPNCTSVYDEVFPDPIPSSTRIPHYAFLDVATGNSFDPVAAMNAGGLESTPVPSATVSSTASSTASSSTPFIIPSSTSPAESKKSNAGAIAGGVVGGVVGFLGIALIAFFFLRRRKRSAPSGPNSSIYNSVAPQETVMGYGDAKFNSAAPVSGKLYDPNDPTTFPINTAGSYYTHSASSDFNQHHIAPSFIGVPSVVGTPVSRPQTHYTGAPEVY